MKTQEYKESIVTIKKVLSAVEESINIPQNEKVLAELKAEQEQDGFWQDMDKAQEVSKKIKAIERKLNEFKSVQSLLKDTDELLDLLELENDENLIKEVENSISYLQSESERLRIESLLNGKYDENNAILTLHAGAGGTEAQDWTEMLYRMYVRYSERCGYTVTVLDYLDGDEAGIKSVPFMVSGVNAYGYLKSEKGVHRLVRISPFDAQKRRHTSFASLEVMPEIDNEIEIQIDDKDLKIDTYRASGAGGQHVNKTSSAIRITHLPTNTVVQCQNERSQLQNKENAMKMLKSKLYEIEERKQLEMAQSIKGDLKKIEWGSQIRSYVFQPYTMVKDHRTGFETGNITAVMDGDIGGFIDDYLVKSAG